jgi:outer membrane receptor for ferrienterochelin and colicins
MIIRILAIAGLGAAGLLCGQGSPAQSIDYGALEQLFGEPVTTSVTGSPQRASDAPGAFEIVTAQDIRRSGARDLPGVLRHVTGIDVLQWGNDDADIGIHGYNQAGSSGVLVLIDGRQVYADFFGFIPWAVLPVELNDIRQIEIAKGPNSALFGFNALRGVINIVTFHPFIDDVSAVSLTGGTQGLAQGSASWSQHLGERAAVRLSVGGNRNDEFTTPQDAFDAPDSRQGNRRGQANLKGYLRMGEKSDLTVELSHGDARHTTFNPFDAVIYELTRMDSAQLAMAADTRAGLIQARAYSNWIDVQNDDPTGTLNFRNQVTVLQLQDVFKLATRHTLRGAIEYRHNTVNTARADVARIFFDNIAASGMWEWHIADPLTWTNAVRVDRLSLGRKGFLPAGFGFTNDDWNDRRISETSANSGLVWRVTDRDTLRFSAARGVQLPNLVSLGATFIPIDHTPFWIGGVPIIEPTVVTRFELHWERSLDFGAQLHLGAYQDTTRELSTFVGAPPRSAILVSSGANVGDSKSHGLELSLKSRGAGNWRWGLSYTPQWIDDDLLPGFSHATTLVDFEDTAPRHVVDASLGLTRGRWDFDSFLRYESHFAGSKLVSYAPTIRAALVPVPAHAATDARVAYRLSPRTTLAVSGQNLLHSRQKQTAASDIERRVLGTLSVDF